MPVSDPLLNNFSFTDFYLGLSLCILDDLFNYICLYITNSIFISVVSMLCFAVSHEIF